MKNKFVHFDPFSLHNRSIGSNYEKFKKNHEFITRQLDKHDWENSLFCRMDYLYLPAIPLWVEEKYMWAELWKLFNCRIERIYHNYYKIHYALIQRLSIGETLL